MLEHNESLPAGIEPATFRLTAECSNQLSYGSLQSFGKLQLIVHCVFISCVYALRSLLSKLDSVNSVDPALTICSVYPYFISSFK